MNSPQNYMVNLEQINVLKFFLDNTIQINKSKQNDNIQSKSEILEEGISFAFTLNYFEKDDVFVMPLWVKTNSADGEANYFDMIVEYIFKTSEKIIHDNQSEEELKNLSYQLLPIFFSVAYSTSRGIALVKTESNLFPGILLPIINGNIVLSNLDVKVTFEFQTRKLEIDLPKKT